MSKSRWGGFRKGRQRYTTRWNELRTPEAASQSVVAPTSPTDFDYTTAQGIWNLNSTVNFRGTPGTGGGGGGGSSLSYSFIASFVSSDIATITIPVTAQAGDIAILFDSTATGTIATPIGWTSIYQQDATFETSVSYKIIQNGEPGTTITGQNNTTYSVKIMLVFRPSISISTVTIGSLNASGETASIPAQQSILVSTTPSIVLGMTRAYQSEPLINETFWDSQIYQTEGNGNQMKVFYEIQNTTPANRTVTASGDYGSYNFVMGFCITAN